MDQIIKERETFHWFYFVFHGTPNNNNVVKWLLILEASPPAFFLFGALFYIVTTKYDLEPISRRGIKFL